MSMQYFLLVAVRREILFVIAEKAGVGLAMASTSEASTTLSRGLVV
jgi:hypothetical protein